MDESHRFPWQGPNSTCLAAFCLRPHMKKGLEPLRKHLEQAERGLAALLDHSPMPAQATDDKPQCPPAAGYTTNRLLKAARTFLLASGQRVQERAETPLEHYEWHVAPCGLEELPPPRPRSLFLAAEKAKYSVEVKYTILISRLLPVSSRKSLLADWKGSDQLVQSFAEKKSRLKIPRRFEHESWGVAIHWDERSWEEFLGSRSPKQLEKSTRPTRLFKVAVELRFDCRILRRPPNTLSRAGRAPRRVEQG